MTETNGIFAFMKSRGIDLSWNRLGIKGMGAMAQGLFASLLIGTILNTIGTHTGFEFLNKAGAFASGAAGAAMAVSIGFALESPPFVLYSLVAIGQAANSLGGAGGPLAVYFVTLIAIIAGKLVSKITPVDIIVTPMATIAAGAGAAFLLAPPIGKAASGIGIAIMWATDMQPFVMGIIVSVIMGVVLTLPISSAAICAALGLTGLAGGAALAGCCAHMVGYAVSSFRENKTGGLFAQGLGTSMLQIPNLVKKPVLWLPALLASAVNGPIATCVFRLEQNGPAIASGMGTCGLVGPIGVVTGWFSSPETAGVTAFDWLGLVVISFVIPAVITLLVSEIMRKKGYILQGDLKIDC
ncbi:MAG: PTS sugar transporter subunit IIC [Spirochaetaceae bacterium]|jgi:uncharacterized membrane protein|nr:PTS sugar transporter subunit IIC [Spirochaetaceae bacterium]